jgi:DNA (cytosine-5)-methyltransferase 1
VNYYNENNPELEPWLYELMRAGAIPAGYVDTRSVEDVTPNDLRGFTQHHFFAGIGVWALALRIAGWPDSRPIWTGSCPCQPFSTAGGKSGFEDERHLWPSWFHLIRQRKPNVIFGEQVASADGLTWLDLVCNDLEGADYAVGAVDLCAAGVGAPHIRQRLWFVGHAERPGLEGRQPQKLPGKGRGLEGRKPVESGGFWRAADWIACRDGKHRPVEPGTFPLAHGAAARVVRLRGYGNAIVPQAAAEVIRAYMELEQ